jgi:hypothetical protein
MRERGKEKREMREKKRKELEIKNTAVETSASN